MFRIEVENIKCSGCASSIQKALLKIKNVETATVDVDSDQVIITGEADKEEIIARLIELGYPEKGTNTISCKAKSYMSCALGRLS
ncbi:MAG TPA: heavy-metal-associated domain-containing protein [Flavobacterium sp.]|uniref:heavy-metal-associated domain-containing protein n=1 Tax=Flavobacterium sp. TaxID=239 RepID=UPI002B84EAB6|nr:heavy-metal-associated domain-containing protein [Flavobacterium sp.]HNP32928.1 heavy-metal-associated domain-containing protein [Flavobacterium sp.]